jgi:hypothetical protein
MTIVPTAAKISLPFLRKPAGWARLCQDVSAADGPKIPSENLGAETIINEALRLRPIPRPDSISP